MKKIKFLIFTVALCFLVSCSDGTFVRDVGESAFIEKNVTNDELYTSYVKGHDDKPIPKDHFIYIWNDGERCFKGVDERTICNYKPKDGSKEVKVTL